MQCFRLNTKDGLVLVIPRCFGHLCYSGLEKVWNRSQRRVGSTPRRFYVHRHTFLSHVLALGNSPADLAEVTGHRTEQLLKSYAKTSGRIMMPSSHFASEKTSSGTNSMMSSSCVHPRYLPCGDFVNVGVSELWRQSFRVE